MSGYELPSVGDLKRAAAAGQRITPEDVSVIAQAESELTGTGPVKGGPAGNIIVLFVNRDISVLIIQCPDFWQLRPIV